MFNSILQKLGLAKKDPAPTPPPPAARPPAAAAPPPPPPPPPPKEIPVVDVMAQLEKKAAANPQKLNWKTSIVDLLKLLDIDSSYSARKELAVELGCPAEKMGDSAQMNMWLHKTVLKKIAENGGNVPSDLYD
jgi:type IV secretory pathway VirB10-like protein